MQQSIRVTSASQSRVLVLQAKAANLALSAAGPDLPANDSFETAVHSSTPSSLTKLAPSIEESKLVGASDAFSTSLLERLNTNLYIRRMMDDPVLGQKKVLLLEALGVQIDDKSLEVTKAPSWLELSRNYCNFMRNQGLQDGEFLHPSLVYVRKGEDRTRYQFVDPLNQSLPSKSEGWELAIPDLTIPFHIPPRAFRRSIREGTFPVLFDAHDVNHLLAMMATPSLGSTLEENYKRQESAVMTPELDRRNFLVTEYLTYPKKDAKCLEFLKESRGLSTKDTDLGQLQIGLDKLDDCSLAKYAGQLSQVLSSSLCDFGGASFQSEEKFRYLQGIYGYQDLSGSKPDEAARLDVMIDTFVRPSFEFTHKDGLNDFPFRPFENERLNYVLNINPLITAAGLKAISERLETKSPEERLELRTMLVTYAAEAESLLLHANSDLPAETFVNQFMNPMLESSAPAARLFCEWVPNQELQSVFLAN